MIPLISMFLVSRMIPLLSLFLVSVFCYPDDAVRFPGLSSAATGGLRRPSSSSSPVSSYSITPCFRNNSFCEFSPDYPRDVNIDSNLLQNSLIRIKIFESNSSRRKNTKTSVQTRHWQCSLGNWYCSNSSLKPSQHLMFNTTLDPESSLLKISESGACTLIWVWFSS